MSQTAQPEQGPDLRRGIPEDRLKDGELLRGHVNGDPVILVRRGAVFHAVGAVCTHYSGALESGLVSGDTVRCPLHHACFDLVTGRALRAPGLAPLPVYRVERHLDLVLVTERQPITGPPSRAPAVLRSRPSISRVIVVGAGAAGSAAAITLREEGFAGQVLLIGAEPSPPYDRPNLSKDYLAGSAPEDWLPLRPREEYDSQSIRLALGTAVARIDPVGRTVWLEDGRAFPGDRLLLAPGAVPVRPPIPGIEAPHVFTLRSLGDCHALIQRAERSALAVVIGAGFLGLEVAAALRDAGPQGPRGRPRRPPARARSRPRPGLPHPAVARGAGRLFHLRRSVTAMDASAVHLDDGTSITTDLVIVAPGCKPATRLAESAGLVLDHGIVVDRYLETSVKGIFAAGDAVRWPDPVSGGLTGCGHWSLAGRMGQTAARNLLGHSEAFTAAPFFWSQHYDMRINCTGNTEGVDRIEVVANVPTTEWEQRHYRDDRLVAVTTVGRDRRSLEAEMALERPTIHRALPA